MSMLPFILGTVIIVTLSCGLMLFSVRAAGKPLPGGCGKEIPDFARCGECPKRHRGECPREEAGR